MTFEQIKTRLDTLAQAKARAEGQLTAIKQGWKKELGTDDPDKVRQILLQSQQQLADLQQKQEAYLSQIDGILKQAGV